jgi:hypothetical protein
MSENAFTAPLFMDLSRYALPTDFCMVLSAAPIPPNKRSRPLFDKSLLITTIAASRRGFGHKSVLHSFPSLVFRQGIQRQQRGEIQDLINKNSFGNCQKIESNSHKILTVHIIRATRSINFENESETCARYLSD